ncbi:uncharacterized protein LOC127857469 [Dreissena polymorpha]|uniref:uncharacterized protein LOC127857469 n=1 Tax=Dreissena polymorpha TaxID=45954 RepID=UPI00226405F1|nr:uncharacterized protein LOC127857469 [Dreissena polymorpha]
MACRRVANESVGPDIGDGDELLHINNSMLSYGGTVFNDGQIWDPHRVIDGNTTCFWRYGTNCTRACSENCLNDETCNNVNGECPSGCVDGYDYAKDKTCTLQCFGRYGVNCTHACSQHCLNNENCNHVNGECPSGCVDGYDYIKDKTCSLPCLNSYGRNCKNACSTNCLNNDTCTSTNGECRNGCAVGYNYRIDRTCKTPQLASITVLPQTRSEVISITHRAFETMPGWSTTSPLSANKKETNNGSTASLFAAIGALSMACGLLVATNVITFCIYLRRKKRTTASADRVHSGTDNAYDTLSSAERSTDNYEGLQVAQM